MAKKHTIVKKWSKMNRRKALLTFVTHIMKEIILKATVFTLEIKNVSYGLLSLNLMNVITIMLLKMK